MTKYRQRQSAQFTFQVTLEAIKEAQTLSQLASSFDVHPTQIAEWKRELLQEGSSLFGQQHLREQHEQTARALKGSFCCVALEQRAGVGISMNGRGRAFANIMIERLWRSVS